LANMLNLNTNAFNAFLQSVLEDWWPGGLMSLYSGWKLWWASRAFAMVKLRFWIILQFSSFCLKFDFLSMLSFSFFQKILNTWNCYRISQTSKDCQCPVDYFSIQTICCC
jgi:hypothetical protein